MSKIKLTLKWRFTLLTIIIMTITSAILVSTINYDMKTKMPKVTDNIMSQIVIDNGLDKPIEIFDEVYIGPNNALSSEISTLSYEYIIIDTAIGEAIYNISTTSIIMFFIIIILGGVITYFTVNNALKPVIVLNENIKKINEDNLTCNLKVEGPKDEIKELTISFNKMLAKLDNAFTSQKRFNSSVAHELKTPLAVIKTNIDVLKNRKDKSVEEYENTLEVVEKSILKMNIMIETLLDMIKQENATLDKMVSVDEIIEDVAEDLSQIAKKNDISIEVDTIDIKDKILGNEILLYRAFYNVVENAIKYNKKHGMIRISGGQEKDIIKIIISDTGKGIEEKDFENIFKPFYRCEGINISTSNGIGLGLSLTKSAITIHGGDIKIYSELDKGTEVTFTLPVLAE
ncbi:Sensor protein CpxA [uncultured Clostridium sp.]|uniref:HAMP domain-containing sensor histidine kinase n=1 Tax=uncultured Clostridium sp. TaxID=59620 RepID=UPI0008233650|nr:HAMP domain-containing sensor histidine kinase [uncultured Clostridium sp.]SCK04419.1 Sensor protein CpxA [uncultured Clostridium sp.]